jgi:amidase
MRKFIEAVSLELQVEYVQSLMHSDDPELYDGAHVSLQVVGRRFQEEKILTITEILGDALGKHVV